MIKIYNYCFILLLITIISNKATAQESLSGNENNKQYKLAYFGFGVGLDYGGLGFKGEFLPVKWLGIFTGIGYNFVEPGFNAGFSLKLSDKKVSATIMAMYGYNAAIRIKRGGFGGSSDIHRRSYYGVSIGGGVDIKFNKKGNKVSLALLIPFRNAAFHRDYNSFKDAGYDFKPEITDVVFSVGCNFAFNKKK